jgi:hypothetical protein
MIIIPLFLLWLGGSLFAQEVAAADTFARFVSDTTWTFGEQTWSDRVIVPARACDSVSELSTSDLKKEYRIHNGRYYYTWACVVAARFELCPPVQGWRVPNRDDFKYLVRYATGSTLYESWGVGGYAYSRVMRDESLTGYYWAYTVGSQNAAYGLAYHQGFTRVSLRAQTSGRQVRCVK